MQVRPLRGFLLPDVGADSKGRDDKDFANIEVVIQEVVDGGQRNDGFAKSHREEYRAYGIPLDKVRGEPLIMMGFIV